MDRTTWMTTTQAQPQLQPWRLPEAGRRYSPHSSRLLSVVKGFAPISLDEMDAVALLNRTDTKFVMSTEQLVSALSALQSAYRILSINGQRLNHYRTLYFDTPDFELYNLHVNGRANRYKVRSREYTDSALSFLEVKHKTSKERTIKNRISTDEPVMEMTLEAENWLSGVFPYDSKELEPKLWNTFTRITLVNIQHRERVTLDVNLAFSMSYRFARLDGVAIAEVKMDSGNQDSPFLAQMQKQRIRAQGFSKYCIGASMLYDQVKKNALKPKMLWIEKMTKGVTHS